MSIPPTHQLISPPTAHPSASGIVRILDPYFEAWVTENLAHMQHVGHLRRFAWGFETPEASQALLRLQAQVETHGWRRRRCPMFGVTLRVLNPMHTRVRT